MNRRFSPFAVLGVFFLLGISSFGGPVAHLGYFRRTFVDKRKWLSEADFASLVSLCQFLPGPASSQAGFCIGMLRAGWPGALAAWLGFTAPSAALMLAAAIWLGTFDQFVIARTILHGMQLAAIAVVGQAVLQMARNLCPDTPRRMLAVLAAAILILVPDTPGQIMVLLIGAFIGWFLPQEDNVIRAPLAMTSPSYGTAIFCLVLFAALLGLSVCVWTQPGLALASLFYRTGALVFGGGHVVLPLLQSGFVVPGYVAPGLFLAGYGAAQALPGPLFTFAAFLGAVANIGPGGLHGGLIAMVAIFLPGLLLVSGVLPYWNAIRQNRPLTGCINGVNAVVVGLLAYALLNLITLGGIGNLKDIVIAGIALLVLVLTRIPPFCAVIFCIAAAIIAQNGIGWR